MVGPTEEPLVTLPPLGSLAMGTAGALAWLLSLGCLFLSGTPIGRRCWAASSDPGPISSSELSGSSSVVEYDLYGVVLVGVVRGLDLGVLLSLVLLFLCFGTRCVMTAAGAMVGVGGGPASSGRPLSVLYLSACSALSVLVGEADKGCWGNRTSDCGVGVVCMRGRDGVAVEEILVT
jgi:hypothetical protein